jgi:puromycin-sensitive aminopeptidase
LTRKSIRLRSDVRPSRVDLHVEVDPAAEKRFRGEVAIELETDSHTRTLELHAVDLTLSRVRVEWQGRTLRGALRPRPERETVVVELPERIRGTATLHLAFAGDLRSDLRGLYAAGSGERRYAFTQLEATDARRFFPCFDEPGMKARFRISVTTAPKNAVLSNAPIERQQVRSRRKTVHFRETPPLSTYLVALAVGDLEASEPEMCGETPIRVWHVPGKGHLTAFGLEAARETLARLERYFAHGKCRRGLLPRDPAAGRPGDDHPAGAQARGRGDLSRAGAHVVRRPGHHVLVGRPVAERGLRYLDGFPDRR